MTEGFEKWFFDRTAGIMPPVSSFARANFEDCWGAARREALAEKLPGCGHPRACLTTDEPEAKSPIRYCAWCADLHATADKCLDAATRTLRGEGISLAEYMKNHETDLAAAKEAVRIEIEKECKILEAGEDGNGSLWEPGHAAANIRERLSKIGGGK